MLWRSQRSHSVRNYMRTVFLFSFHKLNSVFRSRSHVRKGGIYIYPQK